MNFDLPGHLPPLLERMDAFIEAEIVPLQAQYPQFFDERREFARTDLDRGGLPSREWEELLGRMRAVADAAGWLRYGLPASLGGQDGTNLDMAVIREHLATRGLGLHNDQHIYRHHRRYRITEGSEEMQMRRVAQRLFGFGRG